MAVSRTTPILIMFALILLGSLASCAAPASYAAPALGVVVDSHLTVLDVQKGSAAEKAGVRPNDVLITLNGVPPASFTAWATEISNMEVGQPYTLTVQRGSDILELTVVSTRYPADSFPPGVTPTIIPTNQYYLR